MPFTHYTTGEAADELRLKVGTLANWRLEGKGPPYVKTGANNSKVLYPIPEFNAWRNSNREGT